MIGVQTALLPAADWRSGLTIFEGLASEFGLRACELHLATDHYVAACPATDAVADEVAARLRPAVTRLGVHLPFAALAASPPPELVAGLVFAARAGADTAILHLRGGVAGVTAWAALVTPLAARARDLGVTLCLENADDVRAPRLVRAIAAVSGASLCLDVGHLYERVYPPRGVWRKLLVANDRFNPRPFDVSACLPAGVGAGGWARVLREQREAVTWLHVHDHDGRLAHRPLGRGRVRWTPLATSRDDLAAMPVILEADHRDLGPTSVRADLRRLEELLEP